MYRLLPSSALVLHLASPSSFSRGGNQPPCLRAMLSPLHHAGVTRAGRLISSLPHVEEPRFLPKVSVHTPSPAQHPVNQLPCPPAACMASLFLLQRPHASSLLVHASSVHCFHVNSQWLLQQQTTPRCTLPTPLLLLVHVSQCEDIYSLRLTTLSPPRHPLSCNVHQSFANGFCRGH